MTPQNWRDRPIHFQARISDWPIAIPALPNNALVKSVSDPGLLRDAVQFWLAAGRERHQLKTCYRHFDLAMPPREWNWEETKLWWRLMFYRFIDRTYLEMYAPDVDLVQGTNETTSNSTWADSADKDYHLQSERAAANVWNKEFRGKRVLSLDRGEGIIPDTCKLTLLSGPVSNDIPKEIFELSVAEDCPIDYHAYTRIWRGERYINDWTDDSGRWAVLESAYGLKPEWVFGECGPYIGMAEGWRHPDVLGGNLEQLIRAMRAWYTDVISTPAFRDGRILGQGAWFSSGSESSWPYYQYFTSDLIALSNGIRDLWVKEESPMSIVIQASTLDQLNAVVKSMQGYTELRRGTTEWSELDIITTPPPQVPPFYTRLVVGVALRVIRPTGLMVYLNPELTQTWSRGTIGFGNTSMKLALLYDSKKDLTPTVGVLCVLKPGISSSFPNGLWIAAIGNDGLPNIEPV